MPARPAQARPRPLDMPVTTPQRPPLRLFRGSRRLPPGAQTIASGPAPDRSSNALEEVVQIERLQNNVGGFAAVGGREAIGEGRNDDDRHAAQRLIAVQYAQEFAAVHPG